MAVAMLDKSVDVVRLPLRARERSSRTVDQRLILRFPRLAAWVFRLIMSSPPRFRLRQVALQRAAELAMESYNRRDLDAVVAGWDPTVEYHPDVAWVQAGLVEPCYRGPEGYRKYIAATDEVWGEENRLNPIELIDLGERFVILADVTMRAQQSGVPLFQAYGLVVTVKGGRLIRQTEYFDHGKALEAVGLGP